MKIETCYTRKQKFMQAVQILSPGDQLTIQAVQRIPEERLPAFPGGAALEFVVAFQKLRETTSISTPNKPKTHAALHAGHNKPAPHSATPVNGRLSRCHALRVKSAEYWLRLGEADQALRELEFLPKSAWNHPSAVKARVAALEALRRWTGAIAQN
jgi:hypothetical protein